MAISVRMSVPSLQYRELLGTAICVFNSNNGFVIENILHSGEGKEDWYELIDMTSGKVEKCLSKIFKEEIEIVSLFHEIICDRNRIIHSFRITSQEDKNKCRDGNDQVLSTKHFDGRQEIITEDYLEDFIGKNEKLSSLLYDLRDKILYGFRVKIISVLRNKSASKVDIAS